MYNIYVSRLFVVPFMKNVIPTNGYFLVFLFGLKNVNLILDISR